MGENSARLLERLKSKRLYFDGAMGTMLISTGLPSNVSSESLCLTNPDLITGIHKKYVEVGCNIITTNTFNLNRDKCKNLEESIKAAIDCAKEAVKGTDCFIAYDTGSIGRLMEPMGTLTFKEAVSIFEEVDRYAEEYGADLILIETMTSLEEMRAAVVAAKNVTSLPVFVTGTFGDNGRLLTGETPRMVVAALQPLGIDAIGVNCSVGPDKIMPVAKELIECSSIPVIVQPNAGLPVIKDGQTVYNIDASQFAGYMEGIANLGACVLGGCCGTTPEYIGKMIEATKGVDYAYPIDKGEVLSIGNGMNRSAHEKSTSLELSDDLHEAVMWGETEDAINAVNKLLLTVAPLDIINGIIIPALNDVGGAFAGGDLFLPELMMSAESATEAIEVVKGHFSKEDLMSQQNSGKEIIIATVKGDVHDIGKNIVKILLESYGFKVYDLGIDVPASKIIEEVQRTGCRLVGLSALMTTTVPAMITAVKELHEANLSISVIVGGAVLTEETAEDMQADFFSSDAMATVNHSLNFYGGTNK